MLVTSDLNLQNKADAVELPYIETPPTLASLRAELTASLDWTTGAGPPVLRLTNNGPASAHRVTYSVETPDLGPPHSRAGPWKIDQLKPGETDRR